MCSMFSSVSPEAYAYQTRSVRLGGHATSIRLEAAFWQILEEISGAQGVSLGKFLTKLHDEVLEFRGETQNFTSMLRCACLTYLGEVRGKRDGERRLRLEAIADYSIRQPQTAP
jgi:predicted DNA-binding ribbon-helix-helix protein